jgi:small ligand-binding sensory domain FIST
VGALTRIGAGLSTLGDVDAATREAAIEARASLGGEPTDLAFVFLSPEHLDAAEDAAAAVREELAPAHLAGCVADGIVARDAEVERGPAVAVWAGSLPSARIESFHATASDVGDAIGVFGFPDVDDASLVALLVDPYTFPAAGLVERLAGVPLVGGVAVGGGERGAQALIADDEVHAEGAVGVVVRDAPVRPLVSQGCAPIGREAVVTRAEGNLVFELAGEPALERLKQELAALSPEQQALATRGLLAGLVIDENRPTYERGDFLMRGLLGIDEESGAIAIGDEVRVGQTLRFHVRDAASADEDLREALAELAQERTAGALLFTCNGRGARMFGEPGHDARLVSAAVGDGVAGFFCGGEIGPVGGRPFLHGFTATLAVFLDD